MPKRGRRKRRARYWRARRFCGEANLAAQDGAHALAADRQMLFAVKFLTEMRIVEASILAAGQFEDGAPQGHGQSSRHGPSAVAVMHPIDAVETIAPLEPLHLPFTQLQQKSSFAYAQPPAYCILNHFHALELFLSSLSPSL
jgi:hypothetical protein